MDAEETRIYTAVIITSVVIGIIIIFFVISIIRQQRRNLELHRQNILAEISGLENERSRIAADLHDELGPGLAAVKMKINSFELSNEDDVIQIEKTNNHIDNILKRIREISYDLMPSALKNKGLPVALKEFVDYTGNRNTIDIQLHTTGEILLNIEKSIHVYRMIQEIIHNTVKHSKASRLTIELIGEKNKIIIYTKDNGTGFDQKEMQNGKGLGLRNLLSRTQLIGGEMFLETKKDKGSEYTFEIPVTHE